MLYCVFVFVQYAFLELCACEISLKLKRSSLHRQKLLSPTENIAP